MSELPTTRPERMNHAVAERCGREDALSSGAMAIDWKGWKHYFCNVNGELASILLDLELRNEAPIESKPWLLWVWVHFQSPRPDGLSSSDEAPMLYEIEDALYAQVSRTCDALPCGRITTEGRREFYFYGKTDTGFREAAKTALSAFEKYRFDFGTKRDPSWEQYLSVLYPSPQSLQRIANADLLNVFAKRGDVHSVPREVRHWLFFRSNEDRSSFREAASAAGFKIEDEATTERALPFAITLTRVQPIDQASIDETVLSLLERCQRLGGEYDGWEAPVTQGNLRSHGPNRPDSGE